MAGKGGGGGGSGQHSIKGNLGIYVRRILPRGLVAEEGSLKEGNYCGGEGGG